MYESNTYEVILQRMLDRVTAQNPNIDTREGSIIFNALAPAANELAITYAALNEVLNATFADTAPREFLIKRAAERGIIVEPATKAIRKGLFTPNDLEVPIGSRFSLNVLNYVVTEKISSGVYMLECETAGYKGNEESGILIPIDYIEGLETANLTDVLIPGEDEEDTEALRDRYFNSLDSKSFGGNIADYKEKTNAIDGVGGVKVHPIWNGGGTVKLVVMDSTFSVPSDALIQVVQTEIDPTQNSGLGYGIAPIGHTVTVVKCGSTTIDVSFSLTFQTGYTWETVKPSVEAMMDAYLSELKLTWEDTSNIVVRISQIETRILDLAGVLDISGTTINGDASNLVVDADNIPVRGAITNV